MSTSLVLACALFAASSLNASLVEIKDPAKIAGLFPAAAKVRVVNVWATWCVPCVEEMADLRQIASALGPDVAVAGVSLDDMIPGDRAEIRRHVNEFLAARSVSFPNAYYSGKSDGLAEYLKFNGEIPITIAFDRNGKELWRRQGRIDRRQTINALRKLLRRK
jgi:thiol-disulfide isomerase/thioredoxin